MSSLEDTSLEDGLYRLLNPEVNGGGNTIGYVAVAGYHLETPVYLSLSQPNNLYEMWVVRRVPRSPAGVYRIQNIGQYQQPSIAINRDATNENMVLTDNLGTSYFIESKGSDGFYAIYTDQAHTEAWTSQADKPINVTGVGAPGQIWKFVSVLNE